MKNQTIADLDFNLKINNHFSFSEFEKNLYSQNLNFINYKIKDDNYIFYVDIWTESSDGVKCKNKTCPGWHKTFEFEIESKNFKLSKLLYKIDIQLSKLLDDNNDWHEFLECFEKISDNEFKIILGS